MKNLSLAITLLFLAMLPSCATSHAVRYAYGHESFYGDEVDPEEGDVSRAIFGVPVILFSIAWDVVSIGEQAIFGVWPLWGDNSLSMNPDKHE